MKGSEWPRQGNESDHFVSLNLHTQINFLTETYRVHQEIM